MVARQETAFLNFFRGLAALWVAVAHCWIWSAGNLPDFLEPKKAVDLFMVLSGFLMFYTIDQRANRESPAEWKTWGRFYVRRYFRIAPAYYVALATLPLILPQIEAARVHLEALNPMRWAATPYQPGFEDYGPVSVLLHATFLFGFLPSYASSSGLPDWSLAVEMQFYAVFPAVYLLLRRTWFGPAAMVLSLGCFVFAHFLALAELRGYVPLYREPSLLALQLPKFLVGALIYEAGRKRESGLLLLAALITALILRAYGASGLSFAALAFIIALCWYRGIPAIVQRMFASKPVEWMAELSYSLYLFHGGMVFVIGWPVISVLGPTTAGRVAMVAAVVAVSYLIAFACYSLVERPANLIGKRLCGSVAVPTLP